MTASPDVLVIGSGIGGATIAAGLAGSGARVTILERGEQLPESPAARDAKAIFIDQRYRPKETWRDGQGAEFNPGNYYYVGGNSKFYGAVMLRYRERDFDALEHADGVSPAWPISYAELEPWYGRAERLFQVRGAAGEDPTEPRHSTDYPHGPVPDEPAIARVRERLSRARRAAVLAAACDRHRPLAASRRHAVGCLSRHPYRQARRRDGAPGQGAAQSRRLPGHRRLVERLLAAAGRQAHRGRGILAARRARECCGPAPSSWPRAR